MFPTNGLRLLRPALLGAVIPLLFASPLPALEEDPLLPATEDYSHQPFTTSPPPLRFNEAAVAKSTPTDSLQIGEDLGNDARPQGKKKHPKGTPKNGNGPAGQSSHSLTGGPWWTEPFDQVKTFKILTASLVPEYAKEKEIKTLGLRASAFFSELQKRGFRHQAVAAMRSGYYTAVARAMMENGFTDRIVYYLELALLIQPDNAEALALKIKIKN